MIQLKENSRVLIVRPDALGDCVLIGPMFSALKNAYPSCHISVLQQRYTAQLYADSIYVDEVIVDWRKDGKAKGLGGFFSYARFLASQNFDAIIMPYTFEYFVFLAWVAGIPVRIGDGNKPFLKPFLTHPVPINFRDITLHEVEQNVRLLSPFGITEPGPSALSPDPKDTETVRQLLLNLGYSGKPLVGIHPSTGGNNRSWGVEGFASFIEQVKARHDVEVVLTGAGKKEVGLALQIVDLCKVPVLNLAGKTDLPQLKGLMGMLCAFVSSDTGPMHMASACGVPILSLSPSKFVKSTRWGPWKTKAVVIQSAETCPLVCRPGCLQPYCVDALSTTRLLKAFEQLQGLKTMSTNQLRTHAFTKSVTLGIVRGKGVSDAEIDDHVSRMKEAGFHVVVRSHSYNILELFSWSCVQDIGVLHCVGCATWLYRVLRPFVGLRLYIPYRVTGVGLGRYGDFEAWVGEYMGLFRG